MMERRQITSMWQHGTASALVTLIRAEGSSYRRPGARILIQANGSYAGTVSGGCLEAEVVRKAEWMVRTGALVERYSTLFDDTAEMPFGLGCGGIVDLLIEPTSTPECHALIAAMEASLRGEASRVITFLPDTATSRTLRRIVFAPDGQIIFASEALAAARIECARGLEPTHEYEGRFVEDLLPPQRLIVLGAGDDAKPLVSMAALLGWSVIVMDGRPNIARAERFPQAEGVVALTAATQLGITSDDAVVLMTHSYEQDRDLLTAVLPIAPRYLGVLGARHRSSLLISEAAVKTGLSVDECCARLCAPVGLDLGGDGPETIALAVIAEAQACCMGKLGTSRRLTANDVAEQVAQGGASHYLQTRCALDATA